MPASRYITEAEDIQHQSSFSWLTRSWSPQPPAAGHCHPERPGTSLHDGSAHDQETHGAHQPDVSTCACPVQPPGTPEQAHKTLHLTWSGVRARTLFPPFDVAWCICKKLPAGHGQPPPPSAQPPSPRPVFGPQRLDRSHLAACCLPNAVPNMRDEFCVHSAALDPPHPHPLPPHSLAHRFSKPDPSIP